MPVPSAPKPPLNADLIDQWNHDGYFIVRNVIERDSAMEVRGVIKNHIMTPDVDMQQQEMDPMDPMGNSPAARQARFRKLARFCVQSPVIWHTIHCGEPVLNIARQFLGDDLLLKFNSVFVKPAKTGSATPWHQDNGLWRDEETEPFNFWMAIDPATKANGCLQFIPGSHRTPILPHVVYEDSIHGELPRHAVEALIERRGVQHIELQPGDAVFWHSNLWHYSPPNTSDHGRIGVAGVYSNPALADQSRYHRNYQWCMKAGHVCEDFPPENYQLDTDSQQPMPDYLKAEKLELDLEAVLV